MTTPDLPVPTPAPGPPPTALPAGWLPDPNGRHEHRYFNGHNWTADVADGGVRAVDPFGAGPTPTASGYPTPGGPARFPTAPAPNGNGMATAALVCGLIGVVLAWMPFIVVAGFVLAVLAIVFGFQGLRRSSANDRGRGKSIAGIVLGAVGVGLSIIGVILSVITFREMRDFIDPAAHTVAVSECSIVDGVATVTGEVTNRGAGDAGFTLYITVEADGAVVERDRPYQIDPIAADTTADWTARVLLDASAGECLATVDVFGQLPFGVEMERP